MLTNIINQFLSFWRRQKPSQRVLLVGITLVLVIVVPVLINLATQPSYSVAFTGLSETDAGQIVAVLDAQSITYQLRGTSTILVPSDQVYKVRLMLAQNGIPQGGTVGFEMFDGSTLGMTEFTQKVNYQRALEGELERTIASLDSVEAVQVHIVTPEKTLLQGDQAPTTASITIKERVGNPLTKVQVRSITALVASSVEGLTPENVVVVDTSGNLLAAGTDESGVTGAASEVDNRRSSELGIAADYEKKVKNLLDTTLGPNRSVVRANVMLDWTQQEVTKQTFEPTPAAVRSQQTLSEAYTSNGGSISGIPGSSSNLPTPVATLEGGETGPNTYQRSETTTNYEITNSQSHQVIPAGEIKRVSLAVLVDGITDQQVLDTLSQSISSAVGIDATRGDVISVQTLAFDRSYYDAQAVALANQDKTQMYINIGIAVAAAALLFFIFWYVLRVLRNLRMASVQVWYPLLKPGVGTAALSAGFGAPQIAKSIGMASDEKVPFAQANVQPLPLPVIKSSQKLPAVTAEEEQMMRVVAHMAEDKPTNVADIIQLWMNQDKSQNG